MKTSSLDSPTSRRPAKRSAPLPQRQLLVFSVAGQDYALPVHAVQEVVPMATLTAPPCLPAVLAGFLNLAGTCLPVVRLERLFAGPEQQAGLYTPLVILKDPVLPLALLVERVQGLVAVTEQELIPLSHNYTLNDCAEGILALETGHTVLLAADRLLVKQEQWRVAELAALEEARLAAIEESAT